MPTRDRHQLRAEILSEALPYIRQFHGRIVVIKYGGKAMMNEALEEAVVRDVVLMWYVGIRPVLVHGGGPEVSRVSKQLGIEPHFIQGLRVTDEQTLKVAEMVLSGTMNKKLVHLINMAGGLAVGLSGKDARLIVTRRTRKKALGLVGEVKKIQPRILLDLVEAGYIPVVSSLGVDETGETHNVNADMVAASLAAELRAIKCLFLTDVDGIMQKSGKVYSRLSATALRGLRRSGELSQGMIPKADACLLALQKGVPSVHILNGAVPHVLLIEIFSDAGIGTMVTKVK